MKKTIIITAVITALVVFILTLAIDNQNYQGYNAQHWYEAGNSAEGLRQADFKAITCVRGLGYTNLPNLEGYYTFKYPERLDQAGNYYSKAEVDGCLYGL